MRKVKFIEDFATRSKGEEAELDSMTASELVNYLKVAIYVDDTEIVETPKVKKSSKKVSE